MKKILLILSLFIAFNSSATTHIYNEGDDLQNGPVLNGETVLPGDTIFFATDTYVGAHVIKDFHGVYGNPIYIDGNMQHIDADGENIALRVRDCSNLHFFDLELSNSSSQGFYSPQSWNITVDHIISHDHVGTAIRIAYQSVVDVPDKQRASGFVDSVAVVANCIIYNITGSGEAIYMGASNPHWYNLNTDGTLYQYAMLQRGVISGNLIYNIGFDGIQAGSCLDCEIFDNEIYEYGTLEDLSDQNAIQIGQGTNAKVYNNYIHDSGSTVEGYGIFMQGASATIYNNVIVHPYNGIHLGSGAYNGANTTILCFANTITGVDGLIGINVNALYNRNLVIFNNINHHSVEPDDATSFYLDVTNLPENYLISNNLETYEGADAATTIFVDPVDEDFDLIIGSPAIGVGRNLKWFNSGVLLDKSGDQRQRIGAWDVGAFKY